MEECVVESAAPTFVESIQSRHVKEIHCLTLTIDGHAAGVEDYGVVVLASVFG